MDIITLMGLAQAHWDTIMLLVMFGAQATGLVQKQAYKEFGKLCLHLVEQVAVTELSNTDKRKFVVEAAYSLAPAWVKHVVSLEAAEAEAEKAYQLLKGKLGEQSQPK